MRVKPEHKAPAVQRFASICRHLQTVGQVPKRVERVITRASKADSRIASFCRVSSG
jgi:hypothetical protein